MDLSRATSNSVTPLEFSNLVQAIESNGMVPNIESIKKMFTENGIFITDMV